MQTFYKSFIRISNEHRNKTPLYLVFSDANAPKDYFTGHTTYIEHTQLFHMTSFCQYEHIMYCTFH